MDGRHRQGGNPHEAGSGRQDGDHHPCIQQHRRGDRADVARLIEPGSVWTEWGRNVPDGAMAKRRTAVDALHAEDVAQALVYAFAQPPRMLVEEMPARPVKQVLP